MTYTRFFLTLAATSLAACSTEDPVATFGSQNAGANALTTQAAALEPSLSADIPTTGSARYTGFIGLDLGYNNVVGDLSMTVNFENDSVSGTADNFISASNIDYAGSLDLTGGFIDRSADTSLSDPHVISDVDGALSSDGIVSTIDGQLRSTFRGPGRDVMSGFVSGTVDNQLGTSGLNSANSFAVGNKN